VTGGSPTAQDDTAHGWYPVNQLTAPPVIQRLDQLIPSVQNDLDFLLTLPEYPRIVLESPSVSGGKFWLGVAMENGLSIRWGKMGTQGTLKHFALGQCKRNNPVLELKHRFMGKINNGYAIIPHETKLP
jgi:hypothetical protein